MKIAGIACAVPKHEVRASDHYEKFGREVVDRIVGNIGVERRRTVLRGCMSDLCVAASEELFRQTGISKDSIDALILITQTPDFITPGTSGLIQHRLGLRERLLAFDVNRGCPGYCDGFVLAEALLRGLNFHRVLILVGDTPSLRFSPEDQGAAMLFGDCGTATILERSELSDEPLLYVLGIDGGGADAIHSEVGFRHGLRVNEEIRNNEQTARMDGAKVYEFTIDHVPDMTKELLQKAGWTVADTDYFLYHQANRFMIRNLSRMNRIPMDKVPICIDEFGNTSSASIPLTIVTRLRDQLTQPRRLVMLGFGTGLAWTGVAWQWDPATVLCPLVEVDC